MPQECRGRPVGYTYPMRSIFIFTILLLFLITSCTPAPPAAETTAIPVTVSAATSLVGTAIPVVIASLPAGSTPLPFPTVAPPTPIPTLPSGASPAELKYRLLEQFPDLFFCDPDYYPVARDDELDLALQRFPELQGDQAEFQAILNHNGLAGLTTFTDEQKLLIYREHKTLAAIPFELVKDGYRFQMQLAENEGEGFVVTGLIDGRGSITVQDRQPSIATCPICLAAHTSIDTPQGPVAVEDLNPGDVVYTPNTTGRRFAAPILKAVRVFVPIDHPVVHIVLDDGRQLWASPGHPTAAGRALGELHIGDLLDSGHVVVIERLPYAQPATYDILPAGETGWYWANGILIGSALATAR